MVADFKVAILKIFADVCNFADEHAAGTGNGVLLLAALCNDAHDHFADLLLVAAACFFNLSEGSGVDVKGDNIAMISLE